MGIFENFPYTNFHELNLQWILRALKELEHTIDEFVSINALKYADPIQWNITSQYEKNTIVIDPVTGIAYISVQPVPSGVALTNTDYWTVVFDLGSFVTKAAKNFTSNYEEATTLTATMSLNAGDWVIWGDTLYKALVNITAGDTYVPDSNIKQFTMEELCGHLDDLNTTDKSNLVAAINEVLQTLQDTAGDLDNLSTTDKSNLVAAINEILSSLNILDLREKEKPFINVKDYGATGDGVTNDTNAILDAVAVGAPVYFPLGIYLVDNNLSINNPVYLAHGTKIIDSNGVSMIMKPTTNYYNNVVESITKDVGIPETPQGGAAILFSREQINNNTRESFTINGTINAGENKIYTSDDISNVQLGDAIICANIPDFSNVTRYDSMRVIEIGAGYISFAPDKGDASGYGQTGYSYTGPTYTDIFTIRPRIWMCPEFLGVRTGTETNTDAVYWCGNDVAESFGQKIIAREIDALMWNNSSEIMQGLLVTGIKNGVCTNVGVDVQLGGSVNGSVGVSTRHHDVGYYANAWTALRFSDQYFSRSANANVDIAGGIVQESYGAYITKHPSAAFTQVTGDANNVVITMKRKDDNTPAGRFMECLTADGATSLAFINALGQIEGQQLASQGNIIALGDVTGASFKGPLVRCTTLNPVSMIKYEQVPVVETITPNKTITFQDANGTPYKIPIYQA